MLYLQIYLKINFHDTEIAKMFFFLHKKFIINFVISLKI